MAFALSAALLNTENTAAANAAPAAARIACSTKTAQASGRGHALLIADETTIRPTAHAAAAIDRAPRIVLRMGWSG